ncbi:MAG: lysophospholipid acyltransferase family protein [Gammaproteobacteria bacterium]
MLRSILFYLGLATITIAYLPVTVLLFPLPLAVRFRIIATWSVFNLWWLRVTCGVQYRVMGQENIPGGPGIIMCKHQSAWETLALQLVFPAQVWVLKRELLWIPIYGWALASMQPIAIARTSMFKALRQIVRQGCKRLAQGLWVVIFPEGTRVPPGQRAKYQPGGGMLAEKSGFPVVPVAHNSGYFWPRNSLKKWPGTITMVIGPVIEAGGKSAAEITQQAEEWIESTIQQLPVPPMSNGFRGGMSAMTPAGRHNLRERA